MAYQPKSYKKFVATAATATLVATAIVPVASAADAKSFKDVSKTYQEAVNYLVTNDIAQGKSDTMFGTSATITRGDAAVMIAKAMKLDTAKAPSAGFTDVNARVGGSVNALVAAGVVSGKTAKTFAPDANITRQEMAKIITNAYKLEAGSTKNSFKDVNSNWDGFVDALLANGVTVGKTPTTFAATSAVTRGEFALFVFRSENLAPATPSVVSVSATNAKTLSLSGTGLKNLKSENVTVEGSKVLSVTPDAKGNAATLALETPLVDGKDFKVTVKVGEVTKEFTVRYTFVLADVAITTTTLEANKNEQFLQTTINGVVTDLATIDSLGYSIEFQASEAVFTTGTTVSTTGEIDETAAAVALNKSFDVKAVLKKDGKTAESKTVTVKVGSKATPAIGNILITTSELKLTKPVISTKDTTVAVAGVESNTGDVIDKSGLNSFASSNPEIALINAATGVITPIKAGKTTITVTTGSVTYSKEITVVSEERVATKATSNNVNIAPGATLVNNVSITDQFDEKLDSSDITTAKFAVSEVTGKAGVTAAAATVDGAFPVTIAPALSGTTGTYTVVVKDLTTLKNIGQFSVTVSADNTADNYKLEVADTSKGVINLAATAPTLTLNAKEFTKTGAFLQKLDSGDTAFTVESANPTIATVASALPASPGNIVVTGLKIGSTQIILKKAGVQVATATVTVKEEVASIESITWKSNASTITVAGKLLTYKDIFTVTNTAVGIDPIIENVKLNVTTTSKVRFDTTVAGTTAAPVLYLDQNDDGVYLAADDEILGTLATQLSGSAGETIALGTDWTTNILSAATASGNKGTVVITVTDNDSNATVRASSTIKVDVK